MKVSKYIGKICARARRRKGEPQWMVAQKLGTCQQTISNFERGKCDSLPVMMHYMAWFLDENDIKLIKEGVRNVEIRTTSRPKKKYQVPAEPEVAGRSVDGSPQPIEDVPQGAEDYTPPVISNG